VNFEVWCIQNIVYSIKINKNKKSIVFTCVKMAGKHCYECDKELEAREGFMIQDGKKVRGCWGVLNARLFNERACFSCEHYLHRGLEERLRKEILKEREGL